MLHEEDVRILLEALSTRTIYFKKINKIICDTQPSLVTQKILSLDKI